MGFANVIKRWNYRRILADYGLAKSDSIDGHFGWRGIYPPSTSVGNAYVGPHGIMLPGRAANILIPWASTREMDFDGSVLRFKVGRPDTWTPTFAGRRATLEPPSDPTGDLVEFQYQVLLQEPGRVLSKSVDRYT